MIGMTAVGAAGPAQAAAPAQQPEIKISAPERVVTTGTAGKSVPFEVINAGETAATGLTVDFAGATPALDPRLGFQPPQGCTATGCAVGDLAPGARKSFAFTVAPTAELPAIGSSIGLAVHDAGGEWKVTTTITVVRAASGIDLETARIPDLELAAGKSAVLPISVRNNGNEDTEGVAVALKAKSPISFPENYSNCVPAAELPGIVCVFDLVLAPGAVFTISPSTPLTVAAAPGAPGPGSHTAGLAAFGVDDESNDADLAAATKAAKGPGTELKLVPAVQSLAVDERELNDWDNETSFLVKIPLNPADSQAVGGTFKGKAGDTRTVKVGIRNNGPATMLSRSGAWVHAAKVRTPSGLTLTKVDKRCVPNGDGDPSWDQGGRISGREYLCVASKQLAAGEQQLFSFSGKIRNGGDEGSVTVVGGVQDKNAANDVADVDVELTVAAGSGGGSGGTGTGGTGGGGLAVTGAPVGGIAGVGVLLVVAGGLILVLTGRRRVV